MVDDEPGNRELLERFLTRDGCRVETVSNGEAALSFVASRHPDLVLLDVMMPGIDGFEVCGRIKAEPSTRLTPVVLVTGLDAREHKINGIHAGADDFLSKPIDSAELSARVASLVRINDTRTNSIPRVRDPEPGVDRRGARSVPWATPAAGRLRGVWRSSWPWRR